MFSRTHRVAIDRLFDRINFGPQDPNQTHWHQEPTRRQEISHVMSGTIFCVCSTSASSVPLTVPNWCRKEHKKIQVKKESQQSRSRWWIWWPGEMAYPEQAAADSRGSRTCVCAETFFQTEWHTQGEKGELTSSCGNVWSAWWVPPVSREG